MEANIPSRRYSVNAINITKSIKRIDSLNLDTFNWFEEDLDTAKKYEAYLHDPVKIRRIDQVVEAQVRQEDDERPQETLYPYSPLLFACSIALVMATIVGSFYLQLLSEVVSLVLISFPFYYLSAVMYNLIYNILRYSSLKKEWRMHLLTLKGSIRFLCFSLLYYLSKFAILRADSFAIQNTISSIFTFSFGYLIEELALLVISSNFILAAFRDSLIQSLYRLNILESIQRAISSQEGRVAFVPLTEKDSTLAGKPVLELKKIDVFSKSYEADFNIALYQAKSFEYPKRRVFQKAIAKLMFEFLSRNHNISISFLDLSEFITDTEACRDVFNILDVDQDEYITPNDFISSVLSIYENHSNLLKSLHDTKNVMVSLSKIIFFFLLLSMVFISLWIFDLDMQKIIGIAVSAHLSINMSISEAVKNVLLSVIFIFVNNHYKIGDSIIIGQNSDQVLKVKKLDLHYTIFSQLNGQCNSIPNFVLYSSNITNLSRSYEQWEIIKFSFETTDFSPEIISDLEDCVAIFLDKNPLLFFKHFKIRPLDSFQSLTNADRVANTASQSNLLLCVKCKFTDNLKIKTLRHCGLKKFLLETLPKVTSPKEVSSK